MLLAKRNMLCLFIVMLIALGHPLVAKAITLEVSPTFQSVSLGTNAQVDVWFKNPGGAQLSTYQLFLNYDPTILAYQSMTFSAAIGDPGWSVVIPDTGSVFVAYLPDPPALQTGTDDLLLFSLLFSTKGVGTSNLTITDPYLGDPNYDPLSADLVSGIIEVTPSSNPIPEPGTVLLLGAGLLGLLYRRRKNN